jgi:hypothetical protein
MGIVVMVGVGVSVGVDVGVGVIVGVRVGVDVFVAVGVGVERKLSVWENEHADAVKRTRTMMGMNGDFFMVSSLMAFLKNY